MGTNGFAYAVYENASAKEIVISYRGTDNWLSGDAFTNFGVSWSQERQAAEVYASVYASVLRDNPNTNITFTGHSLGGGLAGTMAVWFDRPELKGSGLSLSKLKGLGLFLSHNFVN